MFWGFYDLGSQVYVWWYPFPDYINNYPDLLLSIFAIKILLCKTWNKKCKPNQLDLAIMKMISMILITEIAISILSEIWIILVVMILEFKNWINLLAWLSTFYIYYVIYQKYSNFWINKILEYPVIFHLNFLSVSHR